MSAIEPNTAKPPPEAGQRGRRLRSIIAWFRSLPIAGRLGIISGLFAATAGTITATFTVLGYIDGQRPAPAIAPREIRFIFDMGADGISGPGYDLKLGIQQALDMGPLPFEIIATRKNDEGNKELALKHATDAAQGENVLAVVGHLQSSIMAETLDIYRRSNVPVLMPVPTNPNLTDEIHKTILRMPPNDDDQGTIASNFISSRKNVKYVAIIRDDDNAIYSDYLADKFRAGIDKARADKLDGPVIAFNETIKKGRLGSVHPDHLRALKIDAVFFPGTAGNATTLLEMFGAAQYKPLILMTDGVLTRTFLLGTSEVSERLFVTFQINKTTANPGYPTACADRFAEFELSFCPYGFDAVVLIKQILRTVIENAAITKQQVSRTDMSKHFAGLRTAREPLRGAFNSYKFDKKGENTLVQFAIWHAEKNRKWSLYPWYADNGEGP